MHPHQAGISNRDGLYVVDDITIIFWCSLGLVCTPD